MEQTFVGVPLGQETTVFYRESPRGLEGFVVDNVALVDALKQRVLEERGLSELVEVTSRGGPELDGSGFSHQFAEPFSAVFAQLRLAPLEIPWFERLLVPLSLAVAALLALGLWALYRVVKTHLEFAQRQSNFVSAVTHELKTPLTAIRMHSEMLQEGMFDGPDKAQEYYATITAQTERLSRLIENVLLLSEVERKPAKTFVQDVSALVRKVEKTIGPHAQKLGFQVQVDAPETQIQAVCCADHVEQILFNLVENALKYASNAEDRRITITLEAHPSQVSISVRDRGPGVGPHQLKHIFEPFFRAEDEMTRRHQGSGLGLSLVRNLASQMGASVSAEQANPGLKVSLLLKSGVSAAAVQSS